MERVSGPPAAWVSVFKAVPPRARDRSSADPPDRPAPTLGPTMDRSAFLGEGVLLPRLRVLAAVVGLIVVAGCSSQTPGADNQILTSHNLGGMEATEIIEHLDRLDVQDRPTGLMASVHVNELQLSTGTEELSLGLPEDRFYLSFAPYVNQTHECYYHSLTTCLGELSNEAVQVTVTNEVGEVVVDEELTTFDNGFVGLWLPRDLEGTLHVSAEGGTGQVPVSTGADDPTCLTTIQLT